jgi:hypothetical protein
MRSRRSRVADNAAFGGHPQGFGGATTAAPDPVSIPGRRLRHASLKTLVVWRYRDAAIDTAVTPQ